MSLSLRLPPEHNIGIAIATASQLIAIAIVGEAAKNTLLFVLPAYIGLTYAYVWITSSLKKLKGGSEHAQHARQQVEKVMALSNEEAERQALGSLTVPGGFNCVMSSAEQKTSLEKLGPCLRRLFSAFERIEEINGDFLLDRATISDSSIRPGFLRIGSDFAHSEIVVRPGQDEVYVVYDADHILDGYPTIYHLILLSGQS